MVDNPHYVAGDKSQMKLVPRAFIAISGDKTPEKLRLANTLMTDWMYNMKMKIPPKKLEPPEGKKFKCDEPCPFYQPSSQNTTFRILLGRLKKFHGFRMKYEDFSGFEGSVIGVMETAYKQRQAKWVSFSIFQFTTTKNTISFLIHFILSILISGRPRLWQAEP